MNSIARNLRYWAGKGYTHRHFLVFAGKITAVDLTSWTTASETLKEAPNAIGVVSLPQANQPKGAFDVYTLTGKDKFSTEAHFGDKVMRGLADSYEDAVDQVRRDYYAMVEEQKRYNSDPAYALEKELKSFDWFSHFSDDAGVWRAGEAHSRRIEALKSKVDPKVVEALMEKYRPRERE